MKFRSTLLFAAASLAASALLPAVPARAGTVLSDGIEYSGNVLRWSYNTGDLAYGEWTITTYDEDEVDEDDNPYGYVDGLASTTWAGTDTDTVFYVQNAIGGTVSFTGDWNTLLFDADAEDYSTTGSPSTFTFANLVIAGIIVQEGTTGYSINSSNSNQRNIYLGNATDTVAYSTIHEDFTISNSETSNTSTYFYLYGTQVWTIDEDVTFTLAANTQGFDFAGDNAIITITGGGTAYFSGDAIDGDGSFNVENGTLNLSGSTVNITGDLIVGDDGYVVLSGDVSIGGIRLSENVTADQFSADDGDDDTSDDSYSITLTGGSLEIYSDTILDEIGVEFADDFSVEGTLILGDNVDSSFLSGYDINITETLSLGNDVDTDFLLGDNVSINITETLSLGNNVELNLVDATVAVTESFILGDNVELTLPEGASIDLTTDGTFSIGEGTTLDLSDASFAADFTVELSAGTIIVGENTIIDLTEALEMLTGTADSYVVFSLSGTASIEGWDTLTALNFTVDGEALSGRSSVDVSTDGAVIITYAASSSIVWTGTTDSNWDIQSTYNWTNDGDSDMFYNGDDVTFDATASETDVTVTAEISVGSMTVTGQDYTFTFEEGTSLEADSITIGESDDESDISVTITGTDYDITTDALTVESNATLTLDGTDYDITTDALTVESGSTLTLDGSGTFTVEYNNLELNGTIEVNDDVVLDLGTAGDSSTQVSTYSGFSGDGTIKIVHGYTSGHTNVSIPNFTGDLYWTGKISAGASLSALNAVHLSDDGSGDMSIWGRTTANYTIVFETDYQIGDSSYAYITFAKDVSAVDGTTISTSNESEYGTELLFQGTVTLDALVVKTYGEVTFAGTTTINTLTNNSSNSWNNISATSANTGGVLFTGYATIGTLTMSGYTTFAGGGTIDDIILSGTSTSLVFDGEDGTTYTVGNISLGVSVAVTDAVFTVEDGVTLNVTGTIDNDWGFGTVTIDGTLNVGTLDIATGTDGTNLFLGSGTIIADEIIIYNNTILSIGGNLRIEIGDGGFSNTSSASGSLNLGNTTFATDCSWSSSSVFALGYDDDGTSYTGTTFEIGEGAEVELSGVISDYDTDNSDGKLIKTGAGTLTLSGTNTYSGGTTVSAGTLIASSTSALGTGDVTVSDGATLGATVTDVAVGALTIGDNVTLDFSEITEEAASGIFVASGSVTVGSDVTINLSSELLSILESNESLTIVSASSATVTDTDFSIADIYVDGVIVNQRGSATLEAGDGSVVLTYTAGENYDLTWDGGTTVDDTSGVWVIGGSGWSGSDDTFYTGDSVIFDSSSAVTDVTVSGDIVVNNLTVSSDYTFTFTDDLTLTVNGTFTVDGDVTLSLAGTGTLVISDFDAVSGTVNLDDDTTIEVTTVYNENGTGTSGNMVLVEANVTGTGTVVVSSGTSNYYTDLRIGTTDDDGNTFTGTTYLTAGRYNFTADTTFGGTLLIGDGVSIQVTSSSTFTTYSDIVIEGAWQFFSNNGANAYFYGSVTGDSVTSQGYGTRYFCGDVDLEYFENYVGTVYFAGDGTINIDTLQVGDGGYTSTLYFQNANTTISSIVVNAWAGAYITFSLADGATETTYNVGSFSGATWSYYNRYITVDEGVILNVETFTNNWGFGSLTVNGTMNAGTFTLASGNNASIENNIITGTGTIIADTVVLGNVGTYNFEGGIRLEIGDGGLTTTSSTFALNLGNTTFATESSWSLDDDITLNGALDDEYTGTTFEIGEDAEVELSGDLTDYVVTTTETDDDGNETTTETVYAGKLIKTGAGTLVLSGALTYSGGTVVSEGTLKITSSDAFIVTDEETDEETVVSDVTVAEGTTLALAFASSDYEINVSGTGTIYTNNTIDLTLNATDDDEIFSGSFIVKAGALTLVSAGTTAFDSLTVSGSSAKFDISAFDEMSFNSATVVGTVIGNGDTTLTVGSGSISGTLKDITLVKGSDGTLDLDGATYGTLEINEISSGTISNLEISSDAGSVIFTDSTSEALTFENIAFSGGTIEISTDLSTESALATISSVDESADGTVTFIVDAYASWIEYKVFALTDTSWFSDDNISSLLVDGLESGEYEFDVTTDDDGNSWLTLTVKVDAADLVWAGGDGYWTDTDAWYVMVNGETGTDTTTWSSSATATFDDTSFEDSSEIEVTIVGSDDDGTGFVNMSAFTLDADASDTLTLTVDEGVRITGVTLFDITSGVLEWNVAQYESGVTGYSGTFRIGDNGTLSVVYAGDLEMANTLSGTGTILYDNAGYTLTLDGTRNEETTRTVYDDDGNESTETIAAFTGTLDVEAGTVILANPTGQENFTITVASGAEVQAYFVDSALTIAELTGTGTLTLADNDSSSSIPDTAATLTLTDGDDFSGTIQLVYANLDAEDSSIGGATQITLSNAQLTFSTDGTEFSLAVEAAADTQNYISTSGALTLSGEISGEGTLALINGGDVTFSSEVDFDGTLDLSAAGTTVFSATTSVGTVSSLGTGVVISDSVSATFTTLTSDTAGTLTLGDSASLTATTLTANDDLTVTLGTGASVTSSTMTLNGGTFAFSAAEDASDASVTVNSLVLDGTVGLTVSGVTLTLGSSGISGAGTTDGYKVITFSDATLAAQSSSGWSTSDVDEDELVLQLDGTLTVDTGTGATITLTSALIEADTDNSSELIVTGSGTLVLTELNTNNGDTTVESGTLQYELDLEEGDSAEISGMTVNVGIDSDEDGSADSDATLSIATADDVSATVELSDTTLNFTDGAAFEVGDNLTLEIDNTVTFTGDVTFTSASTGSSRGVFSFTATNSSFTGNNAATLTLSGAEIDVGGGSARVGLTVDDLTITGSTSSTISGDGILTLSGTVALEATTRSTVSVATLNISGDVELTGTGRLYVTSTAINGDSDDTLIVSTSGIVTFDDESGIGSYAGGLTINSGSTVYLGSDGTGDASSLSSLTIAGGGELDGSVTVSDGSLSLELGSTVTGTVTVSGSTAYFGRNDIGGYTAGTATVKNLSLTDTDITISSSSAVTVSGTLTWGEDNTITLDEDFASTITGTTVLITFSGTTMTASDLEDVLQGVASYGRRGLHLSLSSTSIDISLSGALLWNENVTVWETGEWSWVDGDDTSSTTAFQDNDYVMFEDAGSVSISGTEIITSGLIFELDGTFTITSDNDSVTFSSTNYEDNGEIDAGITINSGDIVFDVDVVNQLEGGLYIYAGSLTVSNGDALGNGEVVIGSTTTSDTATLIFSGSDDNVSQTITIGNTYAAIEVTNSDDTVVISNALVRDTSDDESITVSTALTKTGQGTLSILRESDIDSLTVSAGTLILAGSDSSAEIIVSDLIVYAGASLEIEAGSEDGSGTQFSSVTLGTASDSSTDAATLTVSDGSAFRAGSITAEGNATISGNIAVGSETSFGDDSTAGTLVTVDADVTLTVSGNITSYDDSDAALYKEGEGTLEIADGGSVSADIVHTEGTIAFSGTADVSGSYTVSDEAEVTLSTSAGGTFSGLVTLGADAQVSIENDEDSTLTFDGGITLSDTSDPADVTVVGGTVVVNGDEATFGSGSGSGTLTVGDGNTDTVLDIEASAFTADTVLINDGSTLAVGAETTTSVANLTIDGAATLDLTSGATFSVSADDGTAISGSGTLTVTGTAAADDGSLSGTLAIDIGSTSLTVEDILIELSNAVLEINVDDSAVFSIDSVATVDGTEGKIAKTGDGWLWLTSEDEASDFAGTISTEAGTTLTTSRVANATIEIADDATFEFLGEASTDTSSDSALASAVSGSGMLAIGGILTVEGSNGGVLDGFSGTLAAAQIDSPDGSQTLGIGVIYATGSISDWLANNDGAEIALMGGIIISEEETVEITALTLDDSGTLYAESEDTALTVDELSGSGTLTVIGTVELGNITLEDNDDSDNAIIISGYSVETTVTETDENGNTTTTTATETVLGDVTLSGTTSGVDSVSVTDATLHVASADALGDASVSLSATTADDEDNVTTLSLETDGTFTNSIDLAGGSVEIIADDVTVELEGTFTASDTATDLTVTAANAGSLTVDGSVLELDLSSVNFVAEDENSSVAVTVDDDAELDSSSASISGNGSFEKLGDGTLTISGDIGSVGAFTVSEGTVVFESGSELGGNEDGENTLTVAENATLELNGSTLSESTLTGDGSVTVYDDSSLAAIVDATDVTIDAGELSVSGNVSGSNIAFSDEDAQLTLTGDGITVSDTTLSGSTVTLENAAENNGTQLYEESVTFAEDVETLVLYAARGTTEGTVEAEFTGSLEKTGDGTWTVTNYTYGSGATLTVTAGTLIWQNAAFEDGAETLTIDENGTLRIEGLSDDTAAFTGTIDGSGVLEIAESGSEDNPFVLDTEATDDASWTLRVTDDSYVQISCSIPGDLSVSDSGTVVELIIDEDDELDGRVRVSSGATLVKSGEGTLTLSHEAESDSDRSQVTGATLDVEEGEVVQVDDLLWDSTSTLIIADGATFTVRIDEDVYSNGATLSGEGTLAIAETSDSGYTLSGSISDFAGTVTVAEDTTLNLSGGEFFGSDASVELYGEIVLTSSSVDDDANEITGLSGDGTLTIDASASNDFASVIYTYDADGNSSFTGVINVYSGTLSVDVEDLETIGSSVSAVNIGDGSTTAAYGEYKTSGTVSGGFLRVVNDSGSVADATDYPDTFNFASNAAVIFAGADGFEVNGTLGSSDSQLYVLEKDSGSYSIDSETGSGSGTATLTLVGNSSSIVGSVFVASGASLYVNAVDDDDSSSSSTTTTATASVRDTTETTTTATGTNAISGDLTLNGTLIIRVTDDTVDRDVLVDVDGTTEINPNSLSTKAVIEIDVSDLSTDADDETFSIVSNYNGTNSELADVLTVYVIGEEVSVSVTSDGTIVTGTAFDNVDVPSNVRELYNTIVANDSSKLCTALGDSSDMAGMLIALSPVSFGSLLEMQSGFAALETDLLRERLEQRRYERAVAGDKDIKFKPFVNIFGASGESDGNGTDSANYDLTHYGIIGGFDIKVSKNTIAGISIAADWTDADLDGNNGEHEGEGIRLGLYGMSVFENAFVGYGISAGGMSFDTKRKSGYNNETLRGDTDGNDIAATILAGMGFTLSKNYGIDITPYVGLEFDYAQFDSFEEHGGSQSALDIDDTDSSSLRGRIGATLNWRATEHFRIGFDFSYAYEFLDDDCDIDAEFVSGDLAGMGFSSTAYLRDESTIRLGPVIDFRINDMWSLSAAYAFESDLDDRNSHSGNIGVRARF